MKMIFVGAGILCFAFGPMSETARAGFIVNIDATLYGFAQPTDPAPVPGQLIAPFSLAPGGALKQLALGAGDYTITNATGLLGANPGFTGWRFNANPNWVWNFVLADNATNRVVFYADAGGVLGTQAAIAAHPGVQNFSATFSLAAPTTVNFMVRDYFLPDNAGGVALSIERAAAVAVPEPSSFILLTVGAALSVLGTRLRRQRKDPGVA